MLRSNYNQAKWSHKFKFLTFKCQFCLDIQIYKTVACEIYCNLWAL